MNGEKKQNHGQKPEHKANVSQSKTAVTFIDIYRFTGYNYRL